MRDFADGDGERGTCVETRGGGALNSRGDPRRLKRTLPTRSSTALTWATVIAVPTVLIILAWHIAFGPVGRPSTLEAITILVLLLAFIQATVSGFFKSSIHRYGSITFVPK